MVQIIIYSYEKWVNDTEDENEIDPSIDLSSKDIRIFDRVFVWSSLAHRFVEVESRKKVY